ncbi:MAG: N-acetylmuramoyl-L-alanine amidase [Chitinophagales bacterium]
MKHFLILFLSVFSLNLAAQDYFISGTKTFTLSKNQIKGNEITFEIENTEDQPFVAFDLKINGKTTNKFKTTLIKEFDCLLGVPCTKTFNKRFISIELNEDIHFQNENSWSSELQFLATNTKSITIRFEKLGNKVNDINFNFFYPDKTENITKSLEEVQATPPPPANCVCPIPAHETRADWDPAGTHPAQTNPTFTTVTHLIVHHAAGPNTSSDWAATVRSIWNYHVNAQPSGNGWSDIGYNYLIDPNGVIYEGRGDNVLGAHFSGMNGGTMGVCLLGNYQPDVSEDIDPTIAMQNSLIELLAWKECDIDKDPLLSSFHTASNQTQMHISGHRDAGTGTVCPGDNVYDLLPNIRSSCSAYLPNCAFSSNADIVVSALGTNPNTVVIAENTNIEVAVGNGGSLDAIEVLDVALKIDGALVQTFTIDSIHSGEIIDFTLPNYQFLSLGMHQICVYIDSASNETNTANNSYCINIDVEDSVQFFSDLVVLDITSNVANPSVGESTMFSFDLKNLGDDTSSEPVEGKIKVDGVVRQLFNVPVLNINEVFVKTYTKSFASPGLHTVCVEMESPNNETNINNNSYCKSFNILALNSNIQNEVNVAAINLFPNPIKESLRLELSLKKAENFNVSIINNIGKKVFDKQFLNQMHFSETISVKEFSTGVYFLQIEGENTVLNRKLFKE